MPGACDRSEVEALYARHKRPLLGYLRRYCRSPEIADDVFQEVWLKVWKHLDRYQPQRGEFRTWLYRVATNAALDRIRRDRVRAAESLDQPQGESTIAPIDQLQDDAPDPERESLARLDWNRVREAMEDLSEDRRAAVLLRHQQGLSYAEVAVALGVPEGTAKTLVHRAVKRLRNRLGRGR